MRFCHLGILVVKVETRGSSKRIESLWLGRLAWLQVGRALGARDISRHLVLPDAPHRAFPNVGFPC